MTAVQVCTHHITGIRMYVEMEVAIFIVEYVREFINGVEGVVHRALRDDAPEVEWITSITQISDLQQARMQLHRMTEKLNPGKLAVSILSSA